MSPLDAARRLSQRRIHEYRFDGLYSCVLCHWAATRAELDRPTMTLVHTQDCPWLDIPRIVAVLEAVEAYLAPGSEGGGSLARLQALEAALRGEEAP